MSAFSDTVYRQKAATKPIGAGKFGALLAQFEDGTKAVLKVRPFETTTFRGIDRQTTPKREVAASLLDSHVLRFGVVPETLPFRWDKQLASVQKFVEGSLPGEMVHGLFKNSGGWRFRMMRFLNKVDTYSLTKVVLFDLIANNVDRHGKNLIVMARSRQVRAIDNGLCFGRYFRNYRSVFHKYLYYAQFRFPDELRTKLGAITRADLGVLEPYLSSMEIDDTFLRIRFILDHSERLAWKRMSGGTGIRDKAPFPSYKSWFLRQRSLEGLNPGILYMP